MSRLATTTDPDWLPNDHAGELLASEFMDPLALDVDTLAQAVSIKPDRLKSVVDGLQTMTAELDLRLTRYFGLSDGFFLRLQNSYDLLEARRRLNGELDRIIPRAA